jgi:hypothetical protein
MNAEMIREKIPKEERFSKLRAIAKYQIKILNENNDLKTIKKKSAETYISEQKKPNNDTHK